MSDEPEYPWYWKLLLIIIVVCLVVSLISLTVYMVREMFFPSPDVVVIKQSLVESSIQSSQVCSVNGVMVNCSDFKDEFPDYEHFKTTDGYKMDGVCPGWRGTDNRTYYDCITEATR